MSSAELKKVAGERLQQLEQWYASREPREQLILKVLAVVLVVVLLYWLLLAPSLAARNRAQQQYISNVQTRDWIEANSLAINAARKDGKGLPANWVSEVSRSANSFGLTLKGFTPDGNRSVRIEMEDQQASQVVLWLQSLQEMGVVLSNLEMTPGDKSGMATVRATLQQ